MFQSPIKILKIIFGFPLVFLPVSYRNSATPNNILAFETFGKFAAKSIAMPLLHHKYQIRPTQQTLSYSNSCTFFRSRRSHTVATNLLAYPLGRQTSPLILTAHKQYFGFSHGKNDLSLVRRIQD